MGIYRFPCLLNRHCVMLKGYAGEKLTLGGILRRIFAVVLAAAVMGFVLLFLNFIGNLPSIKIKKAYAALQKKEAAFLQKLDVQLIEAGYMRRQVDQNDIYVPAVRLDLISFSQEALKRIRVEAFFRNERQSICSGSVFVANLRPGEDRSLTIKCLDFVGFGSVVKGVPRMETTRPLEYSVRIQTDEFSIAVLQGHTSFHILGR